MAILKREVYDNPTPFDGEVRIGVCYFLEPSYLQGYYFTAGMEDVKFCDTPKRLPNDVIWITNQPFAPQQAYGVYIKNNYFLRVPLDKLFIEIASDLKDRTEKIKRLAYLLQTLCDKPESEYMRYGLSLTHSMSNLISPQKTHDNWVPIANEALSYYWKGSIKHSSLYGASLLAPRVETVLQLVNVPMPDFNVPPRIIKQTITGEVLRQFLLSYYGFVRLSIDSIDRSIQDFIDLERTMWTTYEALWLLDRANITCRAAYVVDTARNHPLKDSEYLFDCESYSWVDGLRSEMLYFCGSQNSVAEQAWLRANGHIAMAMCADFLSQQGVACLGLSFNKIKIAFREIEKVKMKEMARDYGFLLLEEELPGQDFVKEKI